MIPGGPATASSCPGEPGRTLKIPDKSIAYQFDHGWAPDVLPAFPNTGRLWLPET
jgi:hypothetical protein